MIFSKQIDVSNISCQTEPIYWGFQEETSSISPGPLPFFYIYSMTCWIKVDVDQRYCLNLDFSWAVVIQLADVMNTSLLQKT